MEKVLIRIKNIKEIEIMSELIWKVKLVVLFFLISGCKEVKHNDVMEIKIIENISNNTYEKTSFDSKGLRQGISILYSNPKNNILRETIYKDNKKDGIERGYFSNGSLKYIGKYDKGVQDSTWVWFYNNGSIKTINNWSDGAIFGDSYGYTQEGIIDYHNYIMLGGEASYHRKYDESGKRVLEENGVPIFIMINSFKLKKGDSLDVFIYTTADDDFKNRCTVVKLDSDRKEDVVWVNNSEIIRYDYARCSKVLHLSKEMNKIGSEKILIDIELINKTSNKTLKYRDTINVEVSKQ